jgi:hypothetical protein
VRVCVVGRCSGRRPLWSEDLLWRPRWCLGWGGVAAVVVVVVVVVSYAVESLELRLRISFAGGGVGTACCMQSVESRRRGPSYQAVAFASATTNAWSLEAKRFKSNLERGGTSRRRPTLGGAQLVPELWQLVVHSSDIPRDSHHGPTCRLHFISRPRMPSRPRGLDRLSLRRRARQYGS